MSDNERSPRSEEPNDKGDAGKVSPERVDEQNVDNEAKRSPSQVRDLCLETWQFYYVSSCGDCKRPQLVYGRYDFHA